MVIGPRRRSKLKQPVWQWMKVTAVVIPGVRGCGRPGLTPGLVLQRPMPTPVGPRYPVLPPDRASDTRRQCAPSCGRVRWWRVWSCCAPRSRSRCRVAPSLRAPGPATPYRWGRPSLPRRSARCPRPDSSSTRREPCTSATTNDLLSLLCASSYWRSLARHTGHN